MDLISILIMKNQKVSNFLNPDDDGDNERHDIVSSGSIPAT